MNIQNGIMYAIGALIIVAVLGSLGSQVQAAVQDGDCTTSPTVALTGVALTGATTATTNPHEYSGAFYHPGSLCYKGAFADGTTTISAANAALAGVSPTPAGVYNSGFEAVRAILLLIPIGIVVGLLIAGFYAVKRRM